MLLLYPVGEDQINACWRSVFDLAKTVRTTGVELQLMRVSSGATETTQVWVCQSTRGGCE